MSNEPSWSDFRVFLAACRSGSISRTAEALGVSLSTASRRLATLEEELGTALFARTPAGLEPTPAAHALRPHAEAAERAVLAGRAAVESMDTTPVGQVSIAVPPDMTLLILLPRLRGFLEAHPQLTLVLDSGPAVADLNRREADIAVRIERPTVGEELIFSRLRTVDWGLFCRADLLATLADPADPACHRWIGWSGGGPLGAWQDGLTGGSAALRSSGFVEMRHAIAAGLGTGVLPTLFGELTPGLVQVPIPAPPPVELYLVTHRAVRDSPRVAAVWRELERLLRQGDPAEERAELEASIRAAYGW